MTHAAIHTIDSLNFVLRFPSLFHGGRGFAFPCDARGEVDVCALSAQARTNYFAARKAVGRDFGVPAVVAPRGH